MKFYFARQNEYLCIDEHTLLNAMNLALMFGCHETSLAWREELTGSFKGLELSFGGAITPAQEGIYHIATVEARALALAVERALQANQGVMYVMAIALDSCAASGLFETLLPESDTLNDVPEEEIFRTQAEPDEFRIFFQRLVDSLESLTKDVKARVTFPNRYSLALRQLVFGEDREALRQFVAFCRCGGFSIRQGVPS